MRGLQPQAVRAPAPSVLTPEAPPTASPALKNATRSPPPPDCLSGTPQPGLSPPRLKGLPPDCTTPATHPAPRAPPGVVAGGCATAASRFPHLLAWYGPPYLLAPSLHPPGGAAVPAPVTPPSASGWGGSHSHCLVFPLRPPSPAPPPRSEQSWFAPRSRPVFSLDRCLPHVFGHFRPNRRKLPKRRRNLTTRTEGWAETLEPTAEPAEGLGGQNREGGGCGLCNLPSLAEPPQLCAVSSVQRKGPELAEAAPPALLRLRAGICAAAVPLNGGADGAAAPPLSAACPDTCAHAHCAAALFPPKGRPRSAAPRCASPARGAATAAPALSQPHTAAQGHSPQAAHRHLLVQHAPKPPQSSA